MRDVNELLCNPNIDPDEYEAEGYEDFDSLYYLHNVETLVDAPQGLYGIDVEGYVAAFLPGGTIDGYMHWVYIYIK